MEAAGTHAVTSTHPIRLVVNDDLAADPVDRLLPPDPRHPAPAVGGAVGGVIAVLAYIVNWFATLFMGQSPDGLHNFLATFLRYTTHVRALPAAGRRPLSEVHRHGRHVPGRPRGSTRRSGRTGGRSSSAGSPRSRRTAALEHPLADQPAAGDLQLVSSRWPPAACPRACGTSPRSRCGSRRRPTRTCCCCTSRYPSFNVGIESLNRLELLERLPAVAAVAQRAARGRAEDVLERACRVEPQYGQRKPFDCSCTSVGAVASRGAGGAKPGRAQLLAALGRDPVGRPRVVEHDLDLGSAPSSRIRCGHRVAHHLERRAAEEASA